MDGDEYNDDDGKGKRKRKRKWKWKWKWMDESETRQTGVQWQHPKRLQVRSTGTARVWLR